MGTECIEMIINLVATDFYNVEREFSDSAEIPFPLFKRQEEKYIAFVNIQKYIIYVFYNNV
jgi:hypothetical protein